MFILNELTKWGVSAAAAGVLLWRRDLTVAWALLGAIVNVAVCKVLKRIINEQRPAAARKADPGMPSSHAQSLAYLSVYSAVSMVSARWSPLPGLVTYPALATSLLLLAGFMSWLRVSSGYHTMAQVSVGFALGAATAMAWERIGSAWVLPVAAQQTWLASTLVVCMGLGITAFAIKTMRGARSDVLRLQQALRKRL